MCSPVPAVNGELLPIPFMDVEVPLELAGSEQSKDVLLAEGSPVREILSSIRPAWSSSSASLNMEVFTNGITNKIFALQQQQEDNELSAGEKLVFRVFGAGSDRLIDRQTEFANIVRLDRFGIAPPVYARFRNGLVCGFFPGRCLDVRIIRDPVVADKICQTMARMHKMPLDPVEGQFPMRPEFGVKAGHWLDKLPSQFPSAKFQKQFDSYFAGMDLAHQFCRLNTRLEQTQCPVVFCHNDLLIYNILIDPDNEDKVHFIDYEYAGPNYQLFDIGNHLCEYAGVDSPDYARDGPSEQERRHILDRYFFHFRGKPLDENEMEKMEQNTRYFEAASHFLWALWAIHQAQLSEISFSYMDYAICRHQQFHKIALEMGIL